MADMNYKGAIFASKFEQDEDEYENEEEKNSSFIQFKNFSYSHEGCDWIFEMPENEVILYKNN